MAKSLILDKYVCIYCNIDRSTKRGDHIPPQSMFPTATYFGQVPCCKGCNDIYAALDSHVKPLLSILSEHTPTSVIESTKRGLRRGKAHFDALQLQDTVRDGAPRFLISLDRPQFHMWLERLVKGLHYLKYNQRLADSATIVSTVDKNIQDYPVGKELLDDWLSSSSSSLDHMFMAYEVPLDIPNKHYWITVFYSKLAFFSEVSV